MNIARDVNRHTEWCAESHSANVQEASRPEHYHHVSRIMFEAVLVNYPMMAKPTKWNPLGSSMLSPLFKPPYLMHSSLLSVISLPYPTSACSFISWFVLLTTRDSTPDPWSTSRNTLLSSQRNLNTPSAQQVKLLKSFLNVTAKLIEYQIARQGHPPKNMGVRLDYSMRKQVIHSADNSRAFCHSFVGRAMYWEWMTALWWSGKGPL